MAENDPQFDDPAMKAAIKRSLGNESAPTHLRQRALDALANEQRTITRSRIWRSSLAAAAVLLIGLGLAYSILTREKPAPSWFAAAMVVTHDQCAALSDHHLVAGVRRNNLNDICQRLREQLGHPVMAADLGEGWKFSGAGVCEVSKVPAAHLLFTRGDQTISVFSISANILYQQGNSGDGMKYAQIEKDHEIAGIVYGGAIHCLVGYDKSGKMPLAEIVRLRDELGEALVASNASPCGH